MLFFAVITSITTVTIEIATTLYPVRLDWVAPYYYEEPLGLTIMFFFFVYGLYLKNKAPNLQV